MYRKFPCGWSGNDVDLDQLASSALVHWVVHSHRALLLSIMVLYNGFVRVLFQPHFSVVAMLHHHWTNHMDQKIIDQIQKSLHK